MNDGKSSRRRDPKPLRRDRCTMMLLFVSMMLLARTTRGDSPGVGAPAVPASAAPESGAKIPECGDDEECAKIAQQASQYSTLQQWDKAQQAYAAAYLRNKDPMLLYNLGRMFDRGGQLAKAKATYQKYLDLSAARDEDVNRKARQYIATIDRKLADQSTRQPDQQAVLTHATTKEQPRPKPLYNKWWFWTAVGVTATGLAVGVGLGVASRRPDPDDAAIARPFDGKEFR